jgi:hypothetical protein
MQNRAMLVGLVQSEYPTKRVCLVRAEGNSGTLYRYSRTQRVPCNNHKLYQQQKHVCYHFLHLFQSYIIHKTILNKVCTYSDFIFNVHYNVPVL